MNETNYQLSEILNVLNYLQKDVLIPKNVRTKIKKVHNTLLDEDKSLCIRIDKSIQELDEVAEDPNIPMDTKTQLWDIFSKLECIQQ